MSPSKIQGALGGGLLALLGLWASGCEEALGEEAPLALKAERNEAGSLGGESWARVPVPPENGPQLAPVAMIVPVREKPAPDATVLGYLRVGARVARSPEPVTRRDCAGGWYAIRPLGFVCAGPEASVDLNHPVAKAIQVEPDRAHSMPYRYAFLRAIAPNYIRIPTTEEQLKYEMHLERFLKSYGNLHESWDQLDVGANDVPLDARGLATGRIPDHAEPLDMSLRYGGNGDDQIPWWLAGKRRIPNLSSFKVPSYAVISDRSKRHAGVALIGSFVTGSESGGRRFAVATDARLLPADKLKADSGSPFHGGRIKEVGLPVAFVHKNGAHYYRLAGKHLEEDAPAAHRDLVLLTGSVRKVGGDRVVETRDHRWLKSDELRTVVKPSELPVWARRGERWMDVSILNQTLTLWEGTEPVYVTLVSTGRDGLGEPGETLSTPQGTYRVYQKHVTTTMDSNVADHEFELRDVPWVMYFKGGYALHGAYWHDDFGRLRSHGCINLSPIDARYVFFWSSPTVPSHWHAAYASDAVEKGTLVHIHP